MMKALESASQFGGAYVQVVSYRNWLVASRIGGLQVFSDHGSLDCISERALLEIPLLKLCESRLYAVFRRSVWLIDIDSCGQLSMTIDRMSRFKYEPPRGHEVSLDSSVGKFLLDRQSGSVSTPTGVVKLPGYSRPSGIALSTDLERLYVADMGAIYRIEKDNGFWRISNGGYECWGWPKDIAYENGNVFVANVLGVLWYRETACYPYLKLQDGISKFHFRIAKVEVRNNFVYACDEARGLHVFEAKDGKLKPIGGLFVKGGCWDCCLVNDGCYLASGTGGWRWYESLAAAMRMQTSNTLFCESVNGERIQGISNWQSAKAVVVMSSTRVSVVEASTHKEKYVFECNAWSGIAAGDYFVVASSKGLVVIRYTPFVGAFDVVAQYATIEARDISWDGEFLWVADGKGGVKAYAFSQGLNILEYKACFPVCGFTRGLCKTSTRIYAGAGDGGLVVIKAVGE